VSSFNFSTRAGDSFRRTITWLEGDGETAINLTSCSVEFSIVGNNGFKLSFVDNANAYIDNAAGGVVKLELTPVNTRALRKSGLSVFKYEITVTFADGFRQTILSGSLTVDREVNE